MRGLSMAMLLTAATAGLAQDGPRVTNLGPVSADTLALAVSAGRVEYGRQVPYEPQPGDAMEKGADFHTWGWVRRDGKLIGGRVGQDGKLLAEFDRLVGDPLDTAWADRPDSYRVTSPDDPAYVQPVAPLAVHRKTKPSDLAQIGPWDWAAPLEHVLYLALPAPLQVGKQYALTSGGGPLAEQRFTYDPSALRSEAVHVSHVGFRPDDPVKVAFLSCWMGSGGPLRFAEGLTFHVLEEATGESVLTGEAKLAKAAGATDEDVHQRDYNLTDVYRLDFSALTTPGTYRVYVEGVGCSYPFPVAGDAWRRAFVVAAKGYYHQRSGIAIGPPYTAFRRPRAFHPDDGVTAYHSTCGLLDSGNGLNARGTDDDNFGNLVAGKTAEVVPNAWGGYFDAGDWDRRIQHLEATALQLELLELFPEFIGAAALNLPESDGKLPDLVHEALWNLDCYRRMQTPQGGIRGGIESAEHPLFGECSWQESLPVMAYAPDPWSSYVYAGVAARAAHVLRDRAPELAAVYADSATRAFTWAEPEFAAREAEGLPHAVADARNLAAIGLFRATGDARWHDMFLATTVFTDPQAETFVYERHEQEAAAFVYARLEGPEADGAVQGNCRRAMLRCADTAVAVGRVAAFGIARKNPWVPMAWGALTGPQAVSICRAHALSGQDEYLRAALLACQYGAGANPVNLCFTTGLGHRAPEHILCLDARRTSQPTPPGLTALGPKDYRHNPDDWEPKLIAPFCYPPPMEWPTTEAYFDVFWNPSSCEFTVVQPMSLNTYVWGYLAARR